jgi:hypothetical protein
MDRAANTIRGQAQPTKIEKEKAFRNMKKYALSIILAMGVTCVANAQDSQGQNNNSQGQNGPIHVPDGGSTAALLGLSAAAIVLAHRRSKISLAERS